MRTRRLNLKFLVLVAIATGLCSSCAVRAPVARPSRAAAPATPQRTGQAPLAWTSPTPLPPANATQAPSCARYAQGDAPYSEMQLLNDRSGWVLVHHRLMRTDDGGATRRDITPADLPAAVSRFATGELAYFLDASTGWLLATRPRDINTPSDLVVWRTADAGATWRKTRLDGPAVDANFAPPTFFLRTLQFVDARTGWFALEDASGMHAATEIFSTRDGGASWIARLGMQGFSVEGGAIHRASASDAFQVWDDGAGDIAVTHDGGRSWAVVALRGPGGVRVGPGSNRVTYGNVGTAAGMVPVDDGGDGTGIFVTRDAGRTWGLAARAPDACGPLAFVSPEIWLQATDRALYSTEDGGAHWRSVAAAWPAAFGSSAPVPVRVTFADAEHGWAVIGAPPNPSPALVATSDGGHTWRVLRPAG